MCLTLIKFTFFSLLNSHPGGYVCPLEERKNRALCLREREREEHKKLELARVRDLKKA